jgi:hypothetical protein
MIAIHANGIPHVFPDAVLRKPRRQAGRPLRRQARGLAQSAAGHHRPADAKDHDDAVHAEPDPDIDNPGGVIVTVAIADVAWYVRPGSALDREALKRGNSVYFPDRVVPMLPERISNDLCSLREGEDRPALAVRMIFGATAANAATRFHRIIMRRRQALLPAGAGRDRRRAGRQDRPAAGAGPQAAVGRLSLHAKGRMARAAGTRPAGTQDRPQQGRHGRQGRSSRPASTRTG